QSTKTTGNHRNEFIADLTKSSMRCRVLDNPLFPPDFAHRGKSWSLQPARSIRSCHESLFGHTVRNNTAVITRGDSFKAFQFVHNANLHHKRQSDGQLA